MFQTLSNASTASVAALQNFVSASTANNITITWPRQFGKNYALDKKKGV